MKKLSLLLLFSCSLIACKKSWSPEAAIKGKWEWYKTTYFGGISTPQSTGKSWQITFYSNSTFSQTGDYMSQSIPDANGYYNLMTSTLISSLGQGTYIRLSSLNMSSSPVFKYHFISNDSLSLDSGSPFDAPIFYLVRRQ